MSFSQDPRTQTGDAFRDLPIRTRISFNHHREPGFARRIDHDAWTATCFSSATNDNDLWWMIDESLYRVIPELNDDEIDGIEQAILASTESALHSNSGFDRPFREKMGISIESSCDRLMAQMDLKLIDV
ncbi:hypothetical protein RCH21_003079 [Arthrobacter sp. PL16]|nr:hypothetical protein [Arthrobacter sp. PL16]